MKKTNNIISTAMIILLFAFGITVALGSSAYAFQSGNLGMSSTMSMKHSTMTKTKKTSKKTKKDRGSKAKKALNNMGAGCL
jgi:hypothetical protein